VREKLSEDLVESLKAAPKMYAVRDTVLTGFMIRVSPSGKRTWFFDYRNDVGRRLTYKLGTYPGLKHEGARRLAKEVSGKVAAHIDPQAEKKRARREAERARVATLKAFLEHRYEPWALAHLRRGDVAVARLKADFKKWLDEPLESFNTWRLDSWRRDRLRDGAKPVTVNRQIDTLRACLRKAVDWGVVEEHPLQGLKRLKVDDDERVRFLGAEEEKRLRDALVKRESLLRAARDRFNAWRARRHYKPLPARTEEYVDHVRPLVLVGLNTGLRRGELFSLKWGDIDFGSKILTVRAAASKSGDSRRVPLNDEAVAVLEGWKKQEGGGREAYVFPGDDGKRLTRMDKAWDKVCTLAKLEDFRLHDCRHTFASKLVQRGVDLNVVRELLGHADLSMTLRYSHLQPGNLSAAVAKLS
jgi:integrase